MAVEDLYQEVELSEGNLEPVATPLVKQEDLIKGTDSMGEAVSLVLMSSAEVLVASTTGLPVVLSKEVVAALEVREEEVNRVLLVTQAVSPVVDSKVSIQLEVIPMLEVILQVNLAVT
jgi:hypothetical protein